MSKINSVASLMNISCDNKPVHEMEYPECHNKIDIGSDNSKISPISDKELESAEKNKNI